MWPRPLTGTRPRRPNSERLGCSKPDEVYDLDATERLLRPSEIRYAAVLIAVPMPALRRKASAGKAVPPHLHISACGVVEDDRTCVAIVIEMRRAPAAVPGPASNRSVMVDDDKYAICCLLNAHTFEIKLHRLVRRERILRVEPVYPSS